MVGIREKLNQSPALVGLAAVAIAGGALFFSVRSAMNSSGSGIPNAAFYTVDDGKTWFKDGTDKVAPFEYKGKDAVRAYVFRCDDGSTFTAYMERLNAEGKKAIDELIARNELGNSAAISSIYESSVEIKTPEMPQWVRRNTPAGQAALVARCPSGEVGEVVRP